MINSFKDILYVDTLEKSLEKKEIDFDEREDIQDIECICSSDTHFFVICNRSCSKLGCYLFSIEIKNPHNQCTYYINWTNKLDLGNCDLNVMKQENKDGEMEEFVVVSYKSIGINTFNVFVIDLKSKLIRFWSETY